MTDNFFDSFQHIVLTTCPFCDKTNFVQLTPDQWKRYGEWSSGKLLIQNALPDLTADQRELLKTGICSECWEKM